MQQVKICPSCNKSNDISKMECDFCGADISGVDISEKMPDEPTQYYQAPQEEASATIVDSRDGLYFKASDGSGGFEAVNGSIIGREADGMDYLKNYKTVSRRHARLSFSGKWTIEDLDSVNGVYVNESKITSKQPCVIKDGDVVALSRSCKFIVEELG